MIAPHLVAAEAAARGQILLRADPLAARVFASPAQRDTWAYVAQELETLFRAGNAAAKTDLGAALALSLLQQRPGIDGRTREELLAGAPPWLLRVPELQLPVTGWCLLQSRRAALDSVVQMLARYLGDWPHHWVKDGQYVNELQVKPWNGGDDRSRWSRLVFFVEGGDLPTSGRVDFVWADEPPLEEYWSEMLQRARAGGMPFLAWITATPKDKRHWEYLKRRFVDCERRPNGGRVEVVSSMLDNQFLEPKDRAARLARAAGDKRALAILHGAYVDTSGSSPWPQHHAILDHLSTLCTPPSSVLTVDLGDGLTARVEEWGEVDPAELYFACVDCSLGIADEEGKHSPAEVLIGSRARPRGDDLDGQRIPRVVARWNGYLSPYAVGTLLGKLSARWNHALCDVDATGGYGETVIVRARQLGAGFVRTRTQVNGQEFAFDGYRQTVQVVNGIMGGIAEWLERGGEGLEVPSAAAISCLRNARVNDAGKLTQGAGNHTEDVTCLGRLLWLLTRRPAALPDAERPMSNRERLEKALGRKFVPQVKHKRPRPMMG